jgi:hypothetical protein
MQTAFLIDRTDFQQAKFVEKSLPDAKTMAEGEVLLQIAHFSFTSNNITYVMVGEKIGYWHFFPTDEGYGIIPAWGFATVIGSQHADIQVGERFYGYYPMASHLVVKAGKASPAGFLDVSSHRLELPVVYNYYTNTKMDILYSPENEEITSIFRPLFVTSFLLDDFFADNQFFEAQNIILTGASSKTALGLAFLLNLRQKNQDNAVKVIGLTSKTNFDFVLQQKRYDSVLTYEQVGALPTNEKYIVVDFAGNQLLQKDLQIHLGSQLAYNCAVGMTHWDKNYMPEHRTTNKPILFFAPTYAQKRHQDWGNDVFQNKLGVAWRYFIAYAEKWLVVKYANSQTQIREMYLEMLAGKINPREGYVVKL